MDFYLYLVFVCIQTMSIIVTLFKCFCKYRINGLQHECSLFVNYIILEAWKDNTFII